MISTIHPPTPAPDAQISVWLQGLLTIAWADGHFDPEEQAVITELTEQELAPNVDLQPLECVSPNQLAATLGADPQLAENFMRTAVMVAIADGIYSTAEDEVLHQFCVALGLQPKILESLRLTLNYRIDSATKSVGGAGLHPTEPPFAFLNFMREWLDQLEVHDPRLARFLCKLIPPQCPFERDIKLFGAKVVHIPPMCKVNPLYDQLVGLRFRALSYLADDCKEDVSKYY